MKRTLPVCAALLLLPPAGRADTPPAPTPTVIRLTVQPMAAPRPALKYQLLPELKEMNSGNPIQGYLKCFMEQTHFYFSKEANLDREALRKMPLAELRTKNLLHYGRPTLLQADHAARLTTPDWQVLLQLKSEGIHLLLPDVQSLRKLAPALQVRFRAEIAARRFGDAVGTAKTMFALSRHLGEHPTLIGDLVGIAVALTAVGSLEEMIQQPGCPNLYWALSDLPRPLVDLRTGLQGERTLLAGEFALLDEKAPMTEAQLQAAIDRIRPFMKYAEGHAPKGDVGDWLKGRAGDEGRVRAARKRLVEAGLDADKVKQFPAVQVILLDEKLTFEVRRDDAMKALALPFWQAQAVIAREGARQDDKDEVTLFAWAVPSAGKVRMAQVRLEQRIALLRCVEALRLYAAGHDGRLPARLTDVPVPVPLDPVTGKPFRYKLDGGTATVQGTVPAGMEKYPPYNVRYEVSIRK